jgi:hypothetical protein
MPSPAWQANLIRLAKQELLDARRHQSLTLMRIENQLLVIAADSSVQRCENLGSYAPWKFLSLISKSQMQTTILNTMISGVIVFRSNAK